MRWECAHRKLDRLLMMFWFPACDPGYPRRLDVELQCRYYRPDVTVHTTLADTVRATRALLS